MLAGTLHCEFELEFQFPTHSDSLDGEKRGGFRVADDEPPVLEFAGWVEGRVDGGVGFFFFTTTASAC